MHRIDEKIYGHFLEHIYNSCNAGLWGDIVWNHSFEENLSRGHWSVKDVILLTSARILVPHDLPWAKKDGMTMCLLWRSAKPTGSMAS